MKILSKIDNVPLSEHEKQNAIRAITSRYMCLKRIVKAGLFFRRSLRAAGIEKKVVFMGVRNRIEIWSEEYYHERFEKGFESIDQAIDSLREYGF